MTNPNVKSSVSGSDAATDLKLCYPPWITSSINPRKNLGRKK